MTSLNDNEQYTNAYHICKDYNIDKKVHKIASDATKYLEEKGKDCEQDAYILTAYLTRYLYRLYKTQKLPFHKECDNMLNGKYNGKEAPAILTLAMGVLKKLEKLGQFDVAEVGGRHELVISDK